MQQRHFEVIAETIRQIEDDATRNFIGHLFARRLSLTNPRFKFGVFYRAANVTEE
jgi:hypothetical protein